MHQQLNRCLPPERVTRVFVPLVTPFLYGMERAVIELFDALRHQRVSFGANQIVRRHCETTLDEVIETRQQRYQVLALPWSGELVSTRKWNRNTI
jgi:hypothetical protein